MRAKSQQLEHETPLATEQFGNTIWGHTRSLAGLAWGVLLAITLVLASLLQAIAASGLGIPEETALPAAHLSAATAALANGADTRAQFLTNLPSQTLDPTPVSCSVPATDGRGCIS